MTRKVSTTSVTSKGQPGSAQVVTVTRSQSDLNRGRVSASELNKPRVVNGGAPNDVSPWQVTPVIHDAPKPAPQPPARRLHLTTEL